MMTIGFLRPFVLVFIPIVIALLAVIEFVGWTRTASVLRQLGQAERSHKLLKERMRAALLVLLSVVLALVALAGPYTKGTVTRKLLSAVVVFDVSWSMSARDYPEPMPMRFDRAKDTVITALKRYQKGRVGLVAFAGKAFPWTPLMRDFRALEWMLKYWVILGLAPAQGSELKSGLEMALKVANAEFRDPNTGKINAVVIVVSDGTDNDNPPYDVLAEYQKEGVKIISVGVGQPELTEITLPLGCKTDCKTYSTRLNELPLKAIASATGGSYVRVVNGRELADALAKLPDAFTSVSTTVPDKPLYQWPLAASIILAVLWIFRITRT